jgi:hypothetical protein
LAKHHLQCDNFEGKAEPCLGSTECACVSILPGVGRGGVLCTRRCNVQAKLSTRLNTYRPAIRVKAPLPLTALNILLLLLSAFSPCISATRPLTRHTNPPPFSPPIPSLCTLPYPCPYPPYPHDHLTLYPRRYVDTMLVIRMLTSSLRASGSSLPGFDLQKPVHALDWDPGDSSSARSRGPAKPSPRRVQEYFYSNKTFQTFLL